MGWFSNLFTSTPKSEPPAPSEEFQGFEIVALPQDAGGQYRTAGEIRCSIDGELRVQSFVRADLHPSHEQACEHALQKGRQIIRERGDSIWDAPQL